MYQMAQNLILTKSAHLSLFWKIEWEKDQSEIEESFLKIIKIKEERLNGGNVALWLKASALDPVGRVYWYNFRRGI